MLYVFNIYLYFFVAVNKAAVIQFLWFLYVTVQSLLSKYTGNVFFFLMPNQCVDLVRHFCKTKAKNKNAAYPRDDQGTPG